MADFELELIKLLCGLAAVDGEVASVEVKAILAAAEVHGVPWAEVEPLRAALLSGAELPLPDYDVLRANADAVRAAARSLVAADGVLHDAEAEALEHLSEVLRGPSG